MKNEVKLKYQEMYEYDKERYRHDLAAVGETPEAYIAPKISAYMFFVRQRRGVIQRAQPGLSFGQVSALVGEAWKSLPDEEKRQFTDLATADERRYLHQCHAAGVDVVRKRARARPRFVKTSRLERPILHSTSAAPASNSEAQPNPVVELAPR